MDELCLSTEKSSYPIWIGYDLPLEELLKKIEQRYVLPKFNGEEGAIVVVTDYTILSCQYENIQIFEKVFGPRSHIISLTGGEVTKNRTSKAFIENQLLSLGCNKNTLFIAFGGGVIGDLVGFVSSTYYRGCSFVNIPTTLLSMVDSSVGGKTAVDALGYKNIIGTFWQPSAVIIDLKFLKTLPTRHIANGLAEVIKLGVIYNAPLFQSLETLSQTNLEDSLVNIVKRAVVSKAEIVEKDEKDAGLRNILNFGHTIGHALELCGGHSLLHGECVAVGCVYELLLLRRRGKVKHEFVSRVIDCFEKWGLNTKMPKNHEPENLMKNLAADKKSFGKSSKIVNVTGLGSLGSPLLLDFDNHEIGTVVYPALTLCKPSTAPVKKEAEPLFLTVPGSKSVANRLLILAAFSKGSCVLQNLPHNDDVTVMKNALQALGIEIEGDMIHGVNFYGNPTFGATQTPKSEETLIWTENSGTTARFLLPFCGVLCAVRGTKIRMDGNDRMRVRPIGPLVESLRQLLPEIDVQYLGNPGFLPITVAGNGTFDRIKERNITIDASLSSQFLSGFMLVGSVFVSLHIELVHQSQKEATGRAVSESFIEMTISLIRKWGGHIMSDTESGMYIQSRSELTNPSSFYVEADAASASYPLAIAALLAMSVSLPITPSSSLQGDIGFLRVLRSLGCDVIEETDRVTLHSKGLHHLHLPSGKNFSFSDFTDTFLTAAVVFALIAGSLPKTQAPICSISNIANQRLKESNRITGMCLNLRRCGYNVREDDTGLSFFGGWSEPADNPPRVVCESDHRLPMSLAVLATCHRGSLAIPEWRCVEKTFPDFWDLLICSMGLSLRGVPAANPNPPIILVGMRNSGKTYLGKMIAEALNRPFLDLDEVIGDTNKIVRESGWETFRKMELNAFRNILQDDIVISCGGGVVETPKLRTLLKDQPLVLLINQHQDILLQRQISDGKPSYENESFLETLERRRPLYHDVSKYEWSSPDESLIMNFVNTILGPPPPVCVGTTMLCVPGSEVCWSPIIVGEKSDFVEIRCDYFFDQTKNPSIPDAVEQTQMIIERLRGTDKPLIITLRSKLEGGLYTGSDHDYFLFYAGVLRYGVAFIDLELLRLETPEGSKFKTRLGSVGVILSWHERIDDPLKATDPYRLEMKVRTVLARMQDFPNNLSARKIVLQPRPYTMFAPIIEKMDSSTVFLIQGHEGRMSRLLADRLVPVAPESLKVPVSSGQLTFTRRQALRKELGLPGTHVFLLGHPIEESRSPQLQNAFFHTFSSDLRFSRLDITKLPGKCWRNNPEKYKKIILDIFKMNSFGGAAITIPFKELVLPLLDVDTITRKIGAVNTVFRKKTGELSGTNTDWQGILRALRTLKPDDELKTQKALVIGAGGTARAALYVLVEILGMEVFILNRSYDKANRLAKEWGAQVTSPPFASDFALIVSTIPATAQKSLDISESLKPPTVFLELAYMPFRTLYLDLALKHGVRSRSGLDVLIFQGMEQAQKFLGVEIENVADEKVWAKAVYDSQAVPSDLRQILYYW